MAYTRRLVQDPEERSVLTALIVSKEFCEAAVPALKEHLHLFQVRPCQTVARWVIDFWEAHGNQPPFQYIQDIFNRERDRLDHAEAEVIATILAKASEEFERTGGLNLSYELARAQDYLNRRAIADRVEQAQQAERRGDVAEAERALTEYRPIRLASPAAEGQRGFTAAELLTMELPERTWAIQGVLPMGLTLLAGAPKAGKSYFVLNAALALARGTEAFGCVPTEGSRVLYLALEDDAGRLRDRLTEILAGENPPDRLHLYPTGHWPRAHEGGMEQLERWMDEHPDTRLVIVDTLEKFRRPKKASGYDYSEEYQAAQPLQELAARRGVAVVVIDHTRKAVAVDVFDEIQGSRGKAACADTLAVFARPKQGGPQERVLHLRGRDAADEQLALRFVAPRYELLGEPQERMGGERQQAVVEFLRAEAREVARGEIVRTLEPVHGAGLDHTLALMVRAGKVFKTRYGHFASREVWEDLEAEKRFRSWFAAHKQRRERMGNRTGKEEGTGELAPIN